MRKTLVYPSSAIFRQKVKSVTHTEFGNSVRYIEVNDMKFIYSILFRRIMFRNKPQKTHSRSNSTTSYCQHVKPGFRTLLKRRNETIAASQLYEDHPNNLSKSQSRLLTKSQVLIHRETEKEKSKGLDIRQYVKNMSAKRQDIVDKTINLRKPTQQTEESQARKTTRTQISNTEFMKESLTVEKKQKKSIEELERKIQSLISQNMSVLKMQRSKIGLAKWSQIRKSCSLDSDLEEIYQYLFDLREQEQIDKNSQRLTDLNKKIEMLQKMMANEAAQSETLKLQYYSWKNQRNNTTSYSNKKLIGDSGRYNLQSKMMSMKRQFSQGKIPKQSVMSINSTSKLAYKKPSKQYYINPKHKNNSYSLNRQPMPRSSYSTQYLNYGHVPTYCYKPDSIRQTPETSLAIKASNYQQEYKEKLALTKGINFKELDCFRDKFKNTNISFMKCSKKANFQVFDNHTKKHKGLKGQQTKQNSNLPYHKIKSSEPSLIACMNLGSEGDFCQSQHHKQFIWHNTINYSDEKSKDDILKSQIKDKRLHRLKQTFKTLAMRH